MTHQRFTPPTPTAHGRFVRAAGTVLAGALSTAVLAAGAAAAHPSGPVSPVMASSGTATPTASTPVTAVTAVMARPQRSSTAEARRAVRGWAAAWNTVDRAGMAALFGPRGTYEDFAFEFRTTGRAGVATWVDTTAETIKSLRVDVDQVVATRRHATVRWTFSGHIDGASTPFAVPVLTTITLNKHGKIRYLGDYYNRAAVLSQSGLPADLVFE